MRFLTKSLWTLLLLLENCSDCSNRKPIPSQQQQPTPIQGIPNIPITPPADGSPATPQSPPENPIPDNPKNPIPSPGQPPEKNSVIAIWFNFHPYFSKRLIVKKSLIKRIIDVFKINKIENCYLFGNDKPINLNLNDKMIDEILDRDISSIDDNIHSHVLLGLHKDESIKLINLFGMFCTGYSDYITRIDFYDFPTLCPKDTQHMFQRCINLTSLILPEIDYSNLKDCSFMFNNCSQLNLEETNLTKQDISAFDNRLSHLNPVDKMWVFENCPLGDHFHNK